MSFLPETISLIPHSFTPTPYNLRIQRNPRIVFFPENARQVSTIVSHANIIGQRVAARCGGHSYASYSLGGEYGAWVIDLGKFDKIVVDNGGKTASIGAGNSLERVIKELYENGKKAIPTGVCLNVGIGGLTLHGGSGWTTRMWGLTLDAVEQVEVVLANGEIVTATKDVNKDLFFAILGAGSSFGIVTQFKMRLEDAPDGIQYSFKWKNISTSKRKNIVQVFQSFAKKNVPKNMSFRLRILQDYMEITGVYWVSNAKHAQQEKVNLVGLLSGLQENLPPTELRIIDQLPLHKTSLYLDMEHFANEEYRAAVHRTDFQTFASAFLSTGACPELLGYFKENDPHLARFLPYSNSKHPKIIKKEMETAITSLVDASGLKEEDPEVEIKRGDYYQIAHLRKLNERSTFFTTSLFLKDEIPDEYIDKVFQFINHPNPSPPDSQEWYLTIDTLGGKNSQVPKGSNSEYSCFSFRDSLFLIQFDTTTKTGKPPFDLTGIEFCHNLRKTLIAPDSSPKMYYNFIDPEMKGDGFWAHNYYDNADYKKLKVLKSYYDPNFIFWTPQAIGAEDLAHTWQAAGGTGLEL